MTALRFYLNLGSASGGWGLISNIVQRRWGNDICSGVIETLDIEPHQAITMFNVILAIILNTRLHLMI